METKKVISGAGIGILVLLSAVLGGQIILNPDVQYYKCDIKPEYISDCVNGLKACKDDVCTRCYWNEDNKKKYEYCKTGWLQYDQKKLTPINKEISYENIMIVSIVKMVVLLIALGKRNKS